MIAKGGISLGVICLVLGIQSTGSGWSLLSEAEASQTRGGQIPDPCVLFVDQHCNSNSWCLGTYSCTEAHGDEAKCEDPEVRYRRNTGSDKQTCYANGPGEASNCELCGQSSECGRSITCEYDSQTDSCGGVSSSEVPYYGYPICNNV